MLVALKASCNSTVRTVRVLDIFIKLKTQADLHHMKLEVDQMLCVAKTCCCEKSMLYSRPRGSEMALIEVTMMRLL